MSKKLKLGSGLETLLNNYNYKFATVKVYKTGNQVFYNDSYDNNILWDGLTPSINGIYLLNGIVYISPKIKKIDVTMSLWTTNAVQNFRYGIGSEYSQTVLAVSNTFGNYFTWSMANTNTSNDAPIKLCPYHANTIIGDSGWSYAYITITYVD